jgi:hypothetical protein
LLISPCTRLERSLIAAIMASIVIGMDGGWGESDGRFISDSGETSGSCDPLAAARASLLD